MRIVNKSNHVVHTGLIFEELNYWVAMGYPVLKWGWFFFFFFFSEKCEKVRNLAQYCLYEA